MLSLLANASRAARRLAPAFAAAFCLALPLAARGQTLIVQTPISQFFASDGANQDWFGAFLCVYGENILVAANFDDVRFVNQGSAYFFDSSGRQVSKMVALDPARTDRFGEAVILYEDKALIGSVGSDIGSVQNQGAAYLFNAPTGQQLLKLVANDGKAGDQFGVAVELNPERAVVGSYLADIGANTDQGAVYTFDPVTGQQLLKIIAPDGAKGDQFGLSLSLSDGKILVGASGNDIGKNADQGSAYVFNLYTGQKIAKLTASDGKANARFGISVALQNNLALVGAALINTQNWAPEGFAYLYDATTGRQLARLKASDGQYGNLFGQTVALHNQYALVGARLDDVNGKTNAGSAYLYDISDPEHPLELIKYTPNDSRAGDLFGDSVALTDTKAVIGARFGGAVQQGSVYTFALPPPPVITNLVVGAVTSVSAAITWQTNVGTGWNRIDYGTTPDYGQSATASSGGSHSVTLTGLTSSTLYYYRASSGSSRNPTTVTGSFVTAKAPGSPIITVTGATITRNGSLLTADVTLKNSGSGDATSIVVTASSLSNERTGKPLPLNLGPVAVGSTVKTTLTYKGVLVGETTLKLSGTYEGATGGSFSLNRRVTVP